MAAPWQARLPRLPQRVLQNHTSKIDKITHHTSHWPVTLPTQASRRYAQRLKDCDLLHSSLRSWMPQLSITAFVKPAPPMAGQKRKAAQTEDYDSDEIEVASPQLRKPLETIATAQAQNKRTRVLDCVLINVEKRTAGHHAPAKSDIPSTRHVSTAAAARVRTTGSRLKRFAPAPAYDELSDDELLVPTQKPKRKQPATKSSATKKLKSKMPAKKSAADEESDFENDSDLLESEDDSADENASQSSASIMSVDGASDEDTKAPKKKSNSKTLRAVVNQDDKKKTIGKGRSNGKSGTSKNMLNLTQREKGLGKGLDTSLPPLNKIDDIFDCIVEKACGLGFQDAVKHLQGRQLRVATMCSGTESPLLALEMIRKSLKRNTAVDLMIEHAFSVEIVPFKQAYIDRNFDGPVIFRDATELNEVVNDEIPMATTAYGGKAPVPTDIDMLVAGTSCVDFSNLNKTKKSIDEGGESGTTWKATLSFCKAFRPAIVLLENVRDAPWDNMLEEYKQIGYETAGVHIDTKNHYLPQTRQRGYMVCFDATVLQEAGVQSPATQWQSLMGQQRRLASSPVSAFLLRTEQLTKDYARIDDESRREPDWDVCKERHVYYRQHKRLGNARPFTHWQESGTMKVPENASKLWYQSQVPRVRDLMDCSLLRKGLEMYDLRFKTRIFDVTQNVDMSEDSAPFGITGCITPRGQFYVSDAARVLTPEETIILQGLPLDRISFTTETQPDVRDLAGNAMSTPVIGTAIVSALIAGHKMFNGTRETSAHECSEGETRMTMHSTQAKAVELFASTENSNVATLLKIAHQTIRRCFCEGSADLAKRDLQQCVDCAHTTCVSCGGNPLHNYRHSQTLSKGRIYPQMAEAEIRSMLPLQVDFAMSGDIRHLLVEDAETPFFAEYVNLLQQTISGTFSLESIRRTHCITVTYQSSLQAGKLELVLNDHHAEWRMFVYPPRDKPGNDPLRRALQQPVAKSRLSDSLFGGTWSLRSPVQSKVEVLVNGHGDSLPSWWARNEMPDFRDHTQPRFLTVDYEEEDHPRLERSIKGLYEYLPRCGTACESLYKRLNDDNPKEPLHLFKDPSSVGDPKKDCFVFSTEIEQLEYDEVRDVIAQVQAPWSPWDHGISEDSVVIELDGEWSQFRDVVSLRPVLTPLSVRRLADYTAAVESPHCRQAVEIMSCTGGDITNDFLETTTRHRIDLKDNSIFITYSWMFEAMRRQWNANEWHTLPPTHSDGLCTTCAPEKPKLRWKLCPDGESIEPYEDPKTAALYEKAMKQRPAPIVVEADRDRDHSAEVVQIRLGIDVTSMAHRAAARLPPTKAHTKFAWDLRTDFNPGINFSFRPFKLKPIEGIEPLDHDLGMDVQLFPNQRRSLAWMKGQEASEGREYIIEESDEAQLPKLGWAVEMRAKTSVHVRGGICADHPGYGKTILSLALIQSQLLEPGPKKLLEELTICQGSRAPGLIPTIATLVICPGPLVGQWVQEAKEKLGLKEGSDVVSIKNAPELWGKKIAQLREAKLIVVSSGVLGSESYVERLAAFAAVPGPATVKGRAFGKWLEFAITQVPEHVGIFFESGEGKLREFVEEKYARNMNSEDFKAVVPSRRLRGKDFDAAAKSKDKPKPIKAAASASLDTSSVGVPLLEMFYFNRVICDEYHQFELRMLTAIKALRTDKIWGLSGTPAIGDLYNVSKMGELLGVPLAIGTDSERVLKQKSIREFQKEMTSFERFDSMRQMPSDSTLSRKHDLAQKFLDVSATRNVTDFPLDVNEHLVPVTLETDHLALYTEIAQQLNSVDMRKKKGSKSKNTDRETRLFEVLAASETSEEALSRTAAFFERTGGSSANSQSGLNDLISCRSQEAAQCEAEIGRKVPEIEQRDRVAFEQWRQACLHRDVLGDGEAVDVVLRFCKNTDSESKALAFVTKLTKGSGKEDRAKELTTALNTLANRLVVAKRSLRFVEAVRTIQDAAANNKVDVQCDNGSCKASTQDRDIGVSSFCGHVICRSCFKHMQTTMDAECPATACRAMVQSHHMLWASRIGNLQNTPEAPYGAKIAAAVRLLQDIKKQGDQAVLFVQYSSQFRQVGQALEEHGIAATVLDQVDRASQQIEAFKSSDKRITVIVLNASDETAAGLNLQNANHVIFLSPLLRDTQYSYDATMAQTIGRVRRHGQKKQIHVYRIVALDTIDVDILEHRERRISAIVEYETPEINAPTHPPQGYVIAEPKPERMQLVRESGVFSLRPQSWLVCSGADRDEDELDKVRERAGSDRVATEQRIKMKGRVLGWEDFSSLIKFSRAYTEDDE